MGTVTPNMSIFIADSGEISYQSAFKAGMTKVDAHDHSGAPDNGVLIPTAGIKDKAITAEKLAEAIQTTATGTTTDAVLTQLTTISVADSKMVTVKGYFTGLKDDSLKSIGGTFEAVYYRPLAGSVTVVGAAVVAISSNFATATFGLSADIVNNTIDINMTGEAASTVKWTVTYQFITQGV